MKSGSLQLRSPNPKTDKEELYDLVSRTFSSGRGYSGFMEWARNGYFDNGFYDWNASRIGIVDGKIVSHFGVWDLKIKVGSAKIKVAAIGAVATDNDFRKRGLMAKTAPAALKASAEDAYDLSILYGISDFYHRFGFVDAWNEYEYSISTRDLPADGKKVKTEKPKPADVAEYAKLYNRTYGKFSGSAVRPTYPHFSIGGWGTRTEMAVTRGKDGGLNGYVMYKVEDHTLHVWEAIGSVAEVLTVIRTLALNSLCTTVKFPNLPYSHPLALELRKMASDYRTSYRPNGSAMVCSLNLEQTLGKLRPDMSKCLTDSRFADFRGDLGIADGNEAVVLSIRSGDIGIKQSTVKEIQKSSKNLFNAGITTARYLICSGDPRDTMALYKPQVKGLGKELVQVLFPDRHTVIGMWDHF